MPILRNTRQEAFAQNLAKGMTQEAAYAQAGYKPSDAHAARLAGNGRVQERVCELMAPAVKAVEVSVERVLLEMTRLAFYDLTEILDVKDDKITMRDPTSLPEDLRRAITGIKPVQTGEGLYYECKFADKQKALDQLARHLQMFKDTLVVENVFQMIQEMPDEELDRRIRELEDAIREQKALPVSPGKDALQIH